MRFFADENVSRLVIERVRSGGHDVVSAAETRSGAPDQDILGAADAEDRILITEDRDFGEMVIRQRVGSRGVMPLELDRLSNAMEAAAVAEVVLTHADKLAGNLVVIEPGRIRVRPLPVTRPTA
jgi:predicted nuclease of predicted toxin-antitoxin system